MVVVDRVCFGESKLVSLMPCWWRRIVGKKEQNGEGCHN